MAIIAKLLINFRSSRFGNITSLLKLWVRFTNESCWYVWSWTSCFGYL